MENFKSINSFEKRVSESGRIIKKHPDRVPIIVCKNVNDSLPDIDKQKYLVPKDMSIGQFVYIIRKRIKLDANQALFVMVNNSLKPTSQPLSEIYETSKDSDGFLYVVYSSENTFG